MTNMQRFLKKIFWYFFVFWLLNLGLGYYLSTYESQDLAEAGQFYPSLRWNDYYNSQDSIDVLILGSSHAYRSYNPKIIKQYTKNETVFNFGSSGQSPKNGYYVLNEILQKHHPKVLILDIYYMVFTPDRELRNRRYNWQYMEYGKGKRDFFWNGFSFEEKVRLIFFPSVIYRRHLKAKLNKLLGRAYLLGKEGDYITNGFVATADTLSLNELKNNNQFDVFKTKLDELAEAQLHYLKKMKDRCAEENIQLVLMTSPMPKISVEKIGNYQAFSTFFSNLSTQWNIPFLDYNIKRIEEIEDEFHYYDDDHLNAAGATIFSEKVAKVIKDLND